MPSDLKIKTANNAISEVTGITSELSVEVNGHVCNLLFVVLERDDHEALPGLNWFLLTGAGLYHKRNILRFPGESIELLHDLPEVSDSQVPDLVYTEEVLAVEVADEPDIAEELDWPTSSETP